MKQVKCLRFTEENTALSITNTLSIEYNEGWSVKHMACTSIVKDGTAYDDIYMLLEREVE